MSPSDAVDRSTVRGPYFDELEPGRVFSGAPAVTLTEGLQAAHHAIVGNRLRLSLDHRLAKEVCGEAPLASPSLVWDLSIGQSTIVTQHVKANLFYRGLVFHRFPAIGDTLSTMTTVVGLRENQRRQGRPPTGLAALHIVTVDDRDRTVLDYWRCAMLPLSGPDVSTGHADDLAVIGNAVDDESLARAVRDWDLVPLRDQDAGPHFTDLEAGMSWKVEGGDVVSSAPELARLTGNVAIVHHDAIAAGGRRLVYGGHTIGIALLQASRALPAMASVVGWIACDHLGPVHEQDVLRSTVTVERKTPLPGSGGLVWLRVDVVGADPQAASSPEPVLRWRPVVALA